MLLLDVESASVGGALAHFSSHEQPRLFGETRHAVPMLTTRDSRGVARGVEDASRAVLLHATTVAARLRNYARTTSMGEVERVAIFLGAPWGTPDLALGKASFIDSMRQFIAEEVAAALPDATMSFHTAADPAAFSLKVFNSSKTLLLCTVRGEIIEVLLIGEDGVLGYATIPLGTRTILRTLKTHAGLSEHEARSLFTLAPHLEEHHESLQAAARHFVEEFAGAAQALLLSGRTEGVFVIAEEPAGEWFARVLGADDSLEALFPQGGVVRALKPQHFAQHIAANAPQPDLFLMLEALFIDATVSGIY